MSTRYQVLIAGGVFDFETRTNIPVDRSSPGWIAYQAWLTAGNTPLPPDLIGADDLLTAKSKRCLEIDAYAAGLRNAAVRGRSAGEMATWSAKLVEARAFMASSNPADCPLLAAIAAVRGIAVLDLVQRVIAQATPFLQAEAYIDGIRGKHCDNVNAMATVQDVITYDFNALWPVIP